jgi:hypothetical protein
LATTSKRNCGAQGQKICPHLRRWFPFRFLSNGQFPIQVAERRSALHDGSFFLLSDFFFFILIRVQRAAESDCVRVKEVCVPPRMIAIVAFRYCLFLGLRWCIKSFENMRAPISIKFGFFLRTKDEFVETDRAGKR